MFWERSTGPSCKVGGGTFSEEFGNTLLEGISDGYPTNWLIQVMGSWPPLSGCPLTLFPLGPLRCLCIEMTILACEGRWVRRGSHGVGSVFSLMLLQFLPHSGTSKVNARFLNSTSTCFCLELAQQFLLDFESSPKELCFGFQEPFVVCVQERGRS